MKFKINLNGQEQEISVTRQGDQLHMVIDGQATDCRVLHSDGSGFILEQAGRRIRAAGRGQGDQRQLWVNGRTLRYHLVRAQSAESSPSAGALSATIPAIVSQVLVAVGDRVESGDKLILLESMKMIIPIQAPQAGVVKSLHCAPGDAVQPGVPLVELTIA